jgi:hypothetical protein
MATYAQVPAAEQLRAAVSLLSSAAADRQFMAARGLVGALLDDLVHSTGRDLEDVVDPWLLSLATREALAGGDDA